MAIPVYDDDGVFVFDLPDGYQGSCVHLLLGPSPLPVAASVLTADDLRRKVLSIPIMTVYQARTDGVMISRIGCMPDLVSALDPAEVHARSTPTRWQPTAAQLAEAGGNPWYALEQFAFASGLVPSEDVAKAWRRQALAYAATQALRRN